MNIFNELWAPKESFLGAFLLGKTTKFEFVTIKWNKQVINDQNSLFTR